MPCLRRSSGRGWPAFTKVDNLIGQKAKVPVRARHRMYHLIKGREAVRPEDVRGFLRQTEPRPILTGAALDLAVTAASVPGGAGRADGPPLWQLR